MMARDNLSRISYAEEVLLRPLVQGEAHFAYLQALLHGNTQVMTHVWLEGMIEAADLLKAARSLFDTYQILRTCIREHDGQLWFAEHGDFSRIRLRHVETAEAGQVQQHLQEEFVEPIEAEFGLWRLRLIRIPLLNRSVVVLVRNHAISDGFSTTLLLKQLLEALDAVRRGPMPRKPQQRLASWPAMQIRNAAPAVPVESAIAQAAEAACAPAFAFRSLVPVSARTPRFLDMDISSDESIRLTLFCNRNDITVTQLLSALFVKSFCKATGVPGVNLFTAVSLRSGRFHAEPVQDMGCHITVVRTTPSGIDDETLALARACGSLLDGAIRDWRPQTVSHATLRQQVGALAVAGQAAGIAITNVGNIAGSDFPAGLTPLDLRTVVNRIGANYATVLHVMGYNGHIRATLSYAEPAISSREIDAIRAEFRALMTACR